MASDAPPAYQQATQGFSLSLGVDSAEAERVFGALAEKGTVTMPLEATFFAAQFGMVTDQYGVSWMIIHGEPADT